MISTIFNNPHNLWGKWVKLSAQKQLGILALMALCLIYYPAQQYLTLLRTSSAIDSELQQQRAELAHQQQILQALQKKSDASSLTPELAANVLPINRQIQHLAENLQLMDSRWQFEHTPQLTLQLQGHFNELKQFLTALLMQTPQLALTTLHIQKTEEDADFSIQSEISLQLQEMKEK